MSDAGPTGAVRVRHAARVVLVDEDERVLLMEGGDPRRPDAGTWWILPGGGLEAGETHEQGARRELFEETGLRLDALVGPVLHRTARFEFGGEAIEQREQVFAARAPRFELSTAGWMEDERRSMRGLRWWTLAELDATDRAVYPEALADLVREVLPGLTAG